MNARGVLSTLANINDDALKFKVEIPTSWQDHFLNFGCVSLITLLIFFIYTKYVICLVRFGEDLRKILVDSFCLITSFPTTVLLS